jgi:uncharacterized membrane protein YhiD involved in acid resistance
MALKIAITLALGLLVGFEREWSNKDIAVPGSPPRGG